jgi:hypothetical protein
LIDTRQSIKLVISKIWELTYRANASNGIRRGNGGVIIPKHHMALDKYCGAGNSKSLSTYTTKMVLL